jgi:hypothetical protein
MWLKLQENDMADNCDQKEPGEGSYGRVHGVINGGNGELQNYIEEHDKPIPAGWPFGLSGHNRRPQQSRWALRQLDNSSQMQCCQP